LEVVPSVWDRPTNTSSQSQGSSDKLSIDGRLYPTAIEDVIAVLDFTLSRSDSEFLVRYIRWRMDNPIAKQPGQ